MSTDPVVTPTLASARERCGKFLTFFLHDEEYGLEIEKVREIIGMLPITRVPRSPHYIRGVINLRGKVIPIMDLRLRFAMPASSALETCIIVAEMHGMQMGMIVDAMSEVCIVGEEDIIETPFFGMHVNTDFLIGLAKHEGRIKMLLDIDRVLTPAEMGKGGNTPAVAA
ncbi:MAG: chemotaxis protein CheW [bacterium]